VTLRLNSRYLWLSLALAGLSAAGDSRVTVTFRESDAVFANPGIGWMTGNPRNPSPRFPYSVTYTRFNWMDLEPEEGKFDWSPIDTRLEAARQSGMHIAFRIMTASAHSRGYYCSPKWLFDAGCKSFDYLSGGDDPTSGGKRIPRIEPDYSDPMYLAQHGRFLRELGKRYDGNPDIQLVDIGSYGIWGEWHTTHPVAIEVRRRIIDFYTDAFHRTPLVMMSDDAEGLAHALQRGAGMRRDGVGSPWHEKTWIGSKKYAQVPGMADAWKTAPVVFEWYGDYKYMLSKQWPLDRAIQFMLDNHVNLINDNIGAVPPDAMPQLMVLARRAGYRFVLREVSHVKEARRGTQLAVTMKWSNVGVGKLYAKYGLELSLLDAEGNVKTRTLTAVDPSSWLPGEIACEGAIDIGASLQLGVYGIGLALIDPAGRPAIRLAIDHPHVDLRYRVGEVEVKRN
jgi:hypothetical protein